MGYTEGMQLFRQGDFETAAHEFMAATEADENNHKAWNALGICLSKTGRYDTAATSFENAVTLSPDNPTYKKNLAGNEKKRQQVEPDLELDDGPAPVKKSVWVGGTGYQRNWLQIPLYFVPFICAAINPWFGFLMVIVCAWYIKYDADSLNAGSNPGASVWGKMKGWEWMVLLVLFWILMPLYSWKREQVYNENMEYGSRSYVIPSARLPLGKIALGIFSVFFLICILVFVAGAVGSMSSSGVSTSAPAISATDIMNKAQVIPYEELARYPEKYKGKPIMIRGQVSQVIDSFGGVNLRVFSKQSEFSETTWFENDVYVDYKSPKERILEKDVITIYGLADGIQDYTTVLGAQRSIPKIKAVTHTRQ